MNYKVKGFKMDRSMEHALIYACESNDLIDEGIAINLKMNKQKKIIGSAFQHSTGVNAHSEGGYYHVINQLAQNMRRNINKELKRQEHEARLAAARTRKTEAFA